MFPWLSFSVPCLLIPVNAQETYSLPVFDNISVKNLTTDPKQSWLDMLQQTITASKKAAIYGYLAAEYREEGNFPEAISYWDKAAKIYEIENNQASLAKVLADQSQAYLSQGNYRKSTALIFSAIEIAESLKDNTLQTVTWGVLGNIYFVQGNYNQAIIAYQKSLTQAEKINDSKYVTIAANNLFSLFTARSTKYSTELKASTAQEDKEGIARLSFQSKEDRKSALLMANRAVSKSPGGIPGFTALINSISLSPNANYLLRAQNILSTLPNSRNKAYAIIKLSKYLDFNQKIQALEWAKSVSESIGDNRAQSFALGAMGNTYEQANQLDKALNFTQAAIIAAQRDEDSLYRWQWQAGRILANTGNNERAITSYTNAVSTLQSIRSNIVVASNELQFDVRDEVEPVYRELITLLLDSGQVKEVLPVFDLLKLTELQDFFGDECLEIKSLASSQLINVKNNNETRVSSVILKEKTYIILRLPDGSLKSYPIVVTAKELEKTINELRFKLEEKSNPEYLQLSQKVYNLLIRPIEADLAKTSTTSLVFVNDGALRNVPMAVLHDGKQFLIQKYAISISLGLNINSENQKLEKQQVLIFGLSIAIPPFQSLPYVQKEIKVISNSFKEDIFLDEDFTLKVLEKQITTQKPSVVHIASHAKFGGTAESTFIQAFDQKVYLDEFERIIGKNKNPVELLVLSACETTSGDNRSILGLAGVALRNDVKNVLATLWSINDFSSVKLIEEFYYQLKNPVINKADALRQAQLKMIEEHPSTWGAFVLISK